LEKRSALKSGRFFFGQSTYDKPWSIRVFLASVFNPVRNSHLDILVLAFGGSSQAACRRMPAFSDSVSEFAPKSREMKQIRKRRVAMPTWDYADFSTR
jgi:hypothetical protein